MLKHELTEQGAVTVLRLKEKNLDALTVPEARAVVESLVERGGIKVILDMSPVEVIDSSGVGVLVSLNKRLRALGGALRVVGVAGQPLEILKIMRIVQVLAMFPSVDDALSGF